MISLFNKTNFWVNLAGMKDLLSFPNDKRQITYKANLHWISYMRPVLIILACLVLGAFLYLIHWTLGVIAVFFMIKAIINILNLKSTEIYIGDNILTVSYGIFNKRVIDLSLKKYEGMQLMQNFLGRMLNYGRLTVTTGEFTQSFQIENPKMLRESIIESSSKLVA